MSMLRRYMAALFAFLFASLATLTIVNVPSASAFSSPAPICSTDYKDEVATALDFYSSPSQGYIPDTGGSYVVWFDSATPDYLRISYSESSNIVMKAHANNPAWYGWQLEQSDPMVNWNFLWYMPANYSQQADQDTRFWDLPQGSQCIAGVKDVTYDSSWNIAQLPAPYGPAAPPPTDECPNIEGDQSTVPSNMQKDDNGNCVVIPTEPVADLTRQQAIIQFYGIGLALVICGYVVNALRFRHA